MAVKFFKLQESRVGIYRAMLLFGNIGFIGLPMISNVFPEWNFVCFSIYAYRPVHAVDSRCEADISDG